MLLCSTRLISLHIKLNRLIYLHIPVQHVPGHLAAHAKLLGTEEKIMAHKGFVHDP